MAAQQSACAEDVGDACITIMELIAAGSRAESAGLLLQASAEYYGGGTSALTDPEFDRALDAWEGRFGAEGSPRSAPARGRADRHATAAHAYPLLSGWLDKARDTTEFGTWLAKRALGRLVGSPKYDGVSVTTSYERGLAVRATTRGDDGSGVDVTSLIAGEHHFPAAACPAERFGIKYELVMSWGDVERLSEDAGKAYKNPRNLIAGIISSDDRASRRKYVVHVPIDIDFPGCPDDREARLAILGQMIPYFQGNGDRQTPWDWVVLDDVADVLEYYESVRELRLSGSLGFMLDGVVIEAAGGDDIDRLGGRSSEPQYAVAVKFPPMTARTRAVSLDYDLGGTGRLTPCVNFEPVTLEGRTFSRASISNMARFDELRLAPGTPLILTIRGDVLGYLERGGPDPDGAVPFPEPAADYYTTNDDGDRVFAYAAPPLAGRAERLMVKLGVRGVRIQQLSRLVEAGLVVRLGDALRLDRARVAALPGFGEASADLLCSAIGEKLTAGVTDWEVLAAVGIEGVGRSVSKLVLTVWSLGELVAALTAPDTPAAPSRSAVAAALTAAEGLGTGRAAAVLDGLRQRLDDLEDLIALCRPSQTKGAADPAYGGEKYKIVVTGDLVGWGRDQFKTLVEGMGHKMVGSVSTKTSFLITNFPNSGTTKVQRANELGVPVLTEAEAVVRLGLSGAPVASDRAGPPQVPPPAEVDIVDL